MIQANYSDHSLLNPSTRPLLIVLSGPSGAGKDAVLAKVKESGYPIKHITTATTRPRRPGERDDVDYHFVSPEAFREMIENKQLLEWAEVYDNMYGVPRQPVKLALDSGQDVIVKVDIQGAANIKKLLPQAVLIFLTPPSAEDLNLRLKHRRTEAAPDLNLRLKTAGEEIKQLPICDYVVVNRQDEIDMAAAQVASIIDAEKCRVHRREVSL
ncbi:guanylate kinase [Chloroflexota bacterium]